MADLSTMRIYKEMKMKDSAPLHLFQNTQIPGQACCGEALK